MPKPIDYALLSIALAVAGCSQSPQSEPRDAATGLAVPGDADDSRPYDRIAADDIVRFTGTEPFWGGQVAFTSLTYSTPEDPDGTSITVERFAGRGGVSWSGALGGAPFALAVTPGACSDGMSDRSYPFVATLQVQGEERRGCAWTERDPFVAPAGAE